MTASTSCSLQTSGFVWSLSQRCWPGRTLDPVTASLTAVYGWAFKARQWDGAGWVYPSCLHPAHECCHSQNPTHRQWHAHKHTPSVRALIRRWNSAHTSLLEHAITSHVLQTYQSVPRDVYATMTSRREVKWRSSSSAGYTAVLHTNPAPSPPSWLISPVKMFTQRIPVSLSSAWQFNFNLSNVKNINLWT